MTYLGIEFKNLEDLKTWTKEGHIATFKNLVSLFDSNPSMELSSAMSDLADVLVNHDGLTWEEVENLEMAI